MQNNTKLLLCYALNDVLYHMTFLPCINHDEKPPYTQTMMVIPLAFQITIKLHGTRTQPHALAVRTWQCW